MIQFHILKDTMLHIRTDRQIKTGLVLIHIELNRVNNSDSIGLSLTLIRWFIAIFSIGLTKNYGIIRFEIQLFKHHTERVKP